jgi:hypothetical protein
MENERPKPPIAGVIYGTICYWIVVVGILIAIVGMSMYFVSGGCLDTDILLDSLWEGKVVEDVWEEASCIGELPEGHWYLNLDLLSHGDVIAMVGIAIICGAAVVGMWGAFVGTVRSRERLYAVLALIIAVILTLSAIGVVSLE